MFESAQTYSYFVYLLYRLQLTGALDKDNKVYVYGTGEYALELIKFLTDREISIDGLVDDDFGKSFPSFRLPVYSSSDLCSEVKIVIIASREYQEVIYERLTKMQIANTIILKIFEKCELKSIDELGAYELQANCVLIF